MRITNGIMVNNSLYGINKNKVLYDTLNTQLTSQKKIQRPSEDPIIAIRALRLRSTYHEVCMYLDKNIPDARSWIQCTDDALSSINSVLTEITYYCNQGVNDYNTVQERETLVTTLKQLREQIFSDGDADLNGNTLFTGYKTDSTLTFQREEPDTKYTISQNITISDVEEMERVAGLSTDRIVTADQRNITNTTFHVVKLAYDNVDTITDITLTDEEGNETVVAVTVRSKEDFDNRGLSLYTPVTSGAVFVPETGELLLSDNVYQEVATGSVMKVDYEKTGFVKGDLRPEHYFDCKNETTGVEYKAADQEIEYTINFNQTIKVNTQARDVLTHDLMRDIDEMIYAVQTAVDAETKLTKLENDLAVETNEATKKQIESMITAVRLELSYAEDNMGAAFSKGITNYQNHQKVLNYELADLGARLVRLELNEERLSSQKLNVQNQKSANEEINVAAVAVQLKAASNVYDASLMSASQIIQNSLLDFL